MWAPTAADFSSASLRLRRRLSSNVVSPPSRSLAGGDVDLDVELPELGLEVRVGDRLQRLGVLQRRVAGLVDEVELDLEPGHRVVGVEARLAQHPGEHVEVAAHLLPVARAVSAGELLSFDLFAHGPTLGQILGSPRMLRCGGSGRRRRPRRSPLRSYAARWRVAPLSLTARSQPGRGPRPGRRPPPARGGRGRPARRGRRAPAAASASSGAPACRTARSATARQWAARSASDRQRVDRPALRPVPRRGLDQRPHQHRDHHRGRRDRRRRRRPGSRPWAARSESRASK